MKNLPLWPFLAFRTIVESPSCTESICDWGTNPPPATKGLIENKQVKRDLINWRPSFLLKHARTMRNFSLYFRRHGRNFHLLSCVLQVILRASRRRAQIGLAHDVVALENVARLV